MRSNSIAGPAGRRHKPPMTSTDYALLEACQGPHKAAWTYYTKWLARYRAEHPEDDRGDLELIGVFADEVTPRADDEAAAPQDAAPGDVAETTDEISVNDLYDEEPDHERTQSASSLHGLVCDSLPVCGPVPSCGPGACGAVLLEGTGCGVASR